MGPVARSLDPASSLCSMSSVTAIQHGTSLGCLVSVKSKLPEASGQFFYLSGVFSFQLTPD